MGGTIDGGTVGWEVSYRGREMEVVGGGEAVETGLVDVGGSVEGVVGVGGGTNGRNGWGGVGGTVEMDGAGWDER